MKGGDNMKINLTDEQWAEVKQAVIERQAAVVKDAPSDIAALNSMITEIAVDTVISVLRRIDWPAE